MNDGVDGLLVEVENVEELAEKIDLLIRDEKLRKKLGVAAARGHGRIFSTDICKVDFRVLPARYWSAE